MSASDSHDPAGSHPSSRGRLLTRLFDLTLIAIAGLWLVIGVARFSAVAAEALPFNAVGGAPVEAAAAARPGTTSVQLVPESIERTALFESWWGTRYIPTPDGADFLLVLARPIPSRTLGSVVAVVAEREQERGADLRRIVIPHDVAALIGRPAETVGRRADGSTYVNPWATLESLARPITDVPLVRRSYPPVLSPAQYQAVKEASSMRRITPGLSIAEVPDGSSGILVLHALATSPRQYLLVPYELSPERDSVTTP